MGVSIPYDALGETRDLGSDEENGLRPLAASTGASFVREIFTGVYASDFGLWNTNVGEAARHRARLGAGNVKLLFNII